MPNVAPVDELRALLNPAGVPDFEASASTGEGVFPTLKALAKLVLTELKRSSQAGSASGGGGSGGSGSGSAPTSGGGASGPRGRPSGSRTADNLE